VRSDSQRDEGERQSTGKISCQVRYVRRFALAHGNLPSQYPADAAAAVMNPVIGSWLVRAVEKRGDFRIWGTFRTWPSLCVMSVCWGRADFI
jgi:hypothetical protein